MANPNAHLKHLFLPNSEDSVNAVMKFNAFLREIGVPEDRQNIERDFFGQWEPKISELEYFLQVENNEGRMNYLRERMWSKEAKNW